MLPSQLAFWHNTIKNIKVSMETLQHNESVFDKWMPLLTDVKAEAPGVMQTVVAKGGTREAWKHIEDNTETFLMAYPAENYVRAAAVLQGPVDGQLEGMHLIPLLEGIPNTLLMLDAKPWQNKVAGDVLVHNPAIEKSFWLHNPLYFRDREKLQPESVHSIKLAGLVYFAGKAMLDDMTITQGPNYEEHAMQYLADNPGKTRLDVPPLKISLAGKQIIGLGRSACEYQARMTVKNLEEFEFGPEGVDGDTSAMRKMYSFIVNLGTEEQPMYVVLYASETICKDIELKEGMEIDAYFWLQGRIDD